LVLEPKDTGFGLEVKISRDQGLDHAGLTIVEKKLGFGLER